MALFQEQKDIALTTPLHFRAETPARALVLRLSGTASAGVTVTLAMLGRIRAEYDNGLQLGEISIANLAVLSDAFYYLMEATSAIGAAFAFTVKIPLRNEANAFDTNAVHRPIIVYHNGATMGAAGIASGTVTLLAEPSSDAPLYLPALNEYNDTFRSDSYPISEKNTVAVMVFTPAGGHPVVNNIQFIRDGKLVHDGSLAEQQAVTDSILKAGAATLGVSYFQFYEGANFAPVRSNKLLMRLIMGAGAATTETWLVYAAQEIVAGQSGIVAQAAHPTISAAPVVTARNRTGITAAKGMVSATSPAASANIVAGT